MTMTSASTAVPAQREPELAGQTVIVIGGSAGIGFETARRARAEGADVILTGRNAHPKLVEQADLVTEMREVKHPYTKGILAQRGIDY